MKNLIRSLGRYKFVVVGIGFAIVGLILLASSRAASPLLSAEPEDGVLTCATTIMDSAASAGKAVKFGACPASTDPNSVLSLDASGTKIPDTNYAIPAGAIFMDDAGLDTNAGTLAAPVKTLNKAVALAPNPGTIVVRGGIYRDWYYTTAGVSGAIISKSLTIQAYPHEQAWFDGTDVVSTGWTANADNTWSVAWNTPAFCDNKYYSVPIAQQSVSPNSGPCYHWDMSSDPANPRAGDPQMAFVNGTYLHQTVTRAEVAGSANNFYYDHAAKVLYIGTNPAGKTVELTRRPIAFIFGGAPTAPAVKGLGFRRFATSEYGSLGGSVLYMGGNAGTTGGNALIENNTFTANAGGGISARATGGIVRHNSLVKNGYSSMGSNGHSTNNTYDGLMIEDNLVSGNNTERFGTNCGPSCGHAGIKIAHMVGFTARNNIFENTIGGAGFWCDNDCRDAVIVNNISRGNGGAGLFYEVSSRGIIASNLVYNNSQYGLQVASSDMKIYNNTLVNNGATSIWIYDDNRNAQDLRGTTIGPDTRNVQIFNNLMYGGSITTLKVSQGTNDAAGLNTGPNVFMTGLDYNSYYRAEGTGRSMVNWVDDTNTGNYKSLASMQVGHPQFETHGHDIAAPTTDPFFTSLTAGNFTVRSSSPAFNSGVGLPADVAAALGVATGTVTSRGALNWPGKP